MFDPTAFENMKVVIEGAIYDFDLSGQIVVTDRNDCLNMAKLSRLFTISFSLPNGGKRNITAKLEIEASIANLAAELLPDSQPESMAGCYVNLQFLFEAELDEGKYHAIHEMMVDIWGENRLISHIVLHHPLQQSGMLKHNIKVSFERIIREEQLEDMTEMVEVMITALERLEKLI